jgi:hypothetical protein
MQKIKIPPKRWLGNILSSLHVFSDPIQGFMNYEFNKMYTLYCNYIDYGGAQLEDVLFYEFLDNGYALEYGVSENLVLRLKSLRILVDKFYHSTDKLSDFETIRYKGWDEIISLARECCEDLHKIYDKMPDDLEG